MKRWAAAIAVLTACASERAHPAQPAVIASQHEPNETVANVMAVRVWADQEHRRELTNWTMRFERVLNRANRVLEPDVGISFEVREAKPWVRAEPVREQLDFALEELQGIDAGEGVDLVVGLVSALPMFTPELHQIGIARAFGKHIVLRGMDDLRELEALREDEAIDLPEIYRERVAHRETTVFLHEVGHIFGALHLEGSDSLMAPRWSASQSAFDAKNLEMIELVVGHRLRARTAKDLDFDAITELRSVLDQPGWELHDRRDLQFVKAAIDSGALAETPRHPAYAEAWRLLSDDKLDSAWNAVSRLRAEAPHDPRTLELACAVAVQRKGAGALAEADEVCREAANRLPDRTGPLLNLAWAHVEAKNHDGAGRALADVRVSCVKDSCDQKMRGYLAQLHANFGLLSFAEELAATATAAVESQRANEQVRALRKSCGLPKGSGRVPREKEAEYIRACGEARDLLAKRNAKAVLALVARTRAAIADAPGLHLFACEAHLFTLARPRAEKECQAALAAWPEFAEASFYLAVLANMSGRSAQAVRHAERARSLDPQLEAAWSLLAVEYRRAKQDEKLRALEASFQQVFGRSLP